MALAACCWRTLREEPQRGLRELERANDLRALLHGRQRIAVDAE
jgi:hypothetical protein